MSGNTFGPKDPEEIKLLTFDFAGELASGETISTVDITCAAVSGTDAGAAAMLLGVPVISGNKVAQKVQAGINAVTYRLRCKATGNGGLVHVVAGLLPVANNS